MKPIIPPVPVELLKAELTPSKKLVDTNKGHNELYVVTWQDSPHHGDNQREQRVLPLLGSLV